MATKGSRDLPIVPLGASGEDCNWVGRPSIVSERRHLAPAQQENLTAMVDAGSAARSLGVGTRCYDVDKCLSVPTPLRKQTLPYAIVPDTLLLCYNGVVKPVM